MQKKRVALCLVSSENDYQRLQLEDCRAAAQSCDLELQEFSAHNDPERQAAQIREILAGAAQTRPHAIVVHPVRDSRLIAPAREAASMGIGWVVLNRSSDYLDPLKREYPSLPLFSIRPDQYQVGRIQGRQFRALLPGGGELFYIQGPLWVSAAEARFEGVRDELQGTAVKWVTFRSDWTTSGGEEATATWIQTVPRSDVPRCLIGAQNDAMALGARQALLREAERQGDPRFAGIPVTGCDGLPAHGQRWVLDGTFAATVVIPPTAGKAIQGLRSMWTARTPCPREIVLGVSSFPDLERLGHGALEEPQVAPTGKNAGE